jgi:hypothetical protein
MSTRWRNWQDRTPDWWALCTNCGFECCAGSKPLTDDNDCPECHHDPAWHGNLAALTNAEEVRRD